MVAAAKCEVVAGVNAFLNSPKVLASRDMGSRILVCACVRVYARVCVLMNFLGDPQGVYRELLI